MIPDTIKIDFNVAELTDIYNALVGYYAEDVTASEAKRVYELMDRIEDKLIDLRAG